MATIVLQTAGAFIGGIFGPVGAALGRAAGALVGYSLDRSLIASTQRFEGPRMTGQRPFAAEEGAPIPHVAGTARIGGNLIWATRFEERTRTERQGGKGGGPKVTTYSYFANAAFALCEGEIAGVRRIWADGREIERDKVTIRIHRGTEDQQPDPLVAAKQGEGNAPAYRGLAYAVVDRLPLAEYGNRLPQFQFEVLRPIGSLNSSIRAVTLIPGATEYGLATEPVRWSLRPGEWQFFNRQALHGPTDIVASLDELQMLCPNLEHVALVVSWFGDDLRAGACRIRPMVTTVEEASGTQAWRVSGIARGAAAEVSRVDGKAAYGGTPSDRSVIQAIAELKSRGLKVTIHPFVMMDVPADNALPDPWGGEAQPAYPWRGRITCDPAPGVDETADGTAAAASQIAAFCGSAAPHHFGQNADGVTYAGPAGDWGFRRFILHHARLAMAAGGVDAFFLGSEMRGVSTVRDGEGRFRFVEALKALAGEVKAMLGPGTAITYGADWSEYFGHQPADGSGDVLFHLDPLWAHEAIAAVGIDNYMPLADWRDADYGGGNPDGAAGPHDVAALRRAIGAGEGFDWYYADPAARQARDRTPIVDGAHGRDWVFRPKDIHGWWSNAHFDRSGGVEAPIPTAWQPRGKPIWFTEIGCPAIDKGPNQPNAFPDAKSSEETIPHFSNGGRSDEAQRAFLEAHFGRWQEDADGFEEGWNPASDQYDGRMVDATRLYLWAWDARPYPAYPLRTDLWADGASWQTGHWLNGRLSGVSVADIVRETAARAGLPAPDVERISGTVHGHVVEQPATARSVLEPLVDLFGLTATERDGRLVLGQAGTDRGSAPEAGEFVVPDDGATLERARAPVDQLPAEAELGFRDPLADHQQAVARAYRSAAVGAGRASLGFSGTLERGAADALLEDWMRREWAGRETLRFRVAPTETAYRPGAVFAHDDRLWRVAEVEEGLVREIGAHALDPSPPTPWRATEGMPAAPPAIAGPPAVLFLDLPMGPSGGAAESRFQIAARARPWRSQVALASPESSGFAERATLTRPAAIGRLAEALAAAGSGRIWNDAGLVVELFEGEFASASRLQMFNGANAAAIRSGSGAWEILQFEGADEIAPSVWRLSGLLRGQLGTEDAAEAGAETGADFVLVDDALVPAGLQPAEAGLTLAWLVGPVGEDIAGGNFVERQETGGLRARRPLAPVHLRAERREDGGAELRWTRRGRIAADSWEGDDIPLGEEQEAYRLEILGPGGAVLRTAETAAPSWTYALSAIEADFGAVPELIDVRVRQLGSAAGLPARRTLEL